MSAVTPWDIKEPILQNEETEKIVRGRRRARTPGQVAIALRDLFEASDYRTVRDLCRESGMNVSLVHRLLRGRLKKFENKMRYSTHIAKLALTFDVTVEDILLTEESA